MKKLKYVLFIILLIFTFNVKAEEDDSLTKACQTKEMSRLKEIAKKVEFDYDYTLSGDNVEFSINATNLNDELMVLIIKNYYTNDYREFKGEEKATLKGFDPGESVVITIKAFVPNKCSGNTILTKTINELSSFALFFISLHQLNKKIAR